MIHIVVASKNPVKVEAARRGFTQMFPGESFSFSLVSTPSGVSDQPMSTEETLLGAVNRANGACLIETNADYWVGIEGGVEEDAGELAAFAWVVIRNREIYGKGRTATFFLPSEVAELVRAGKELGEADDIVFGRSNSKQENGAVGLLTGDVIDRAALYEQAVVMALIPFKNPDLYAQKEGAESGNSQL